MFINKLIPRKKAKLLTFSLKYNVHIHERFPTQNTMISFTD